MSLPERILYAKPSITELERLYVADAMAHGWGDQCYAYIERFEREFAQWVGSLHAIATSSGTGALHLGLAALGIGPGDEVILADTNWIASVAPVVHLGATPVFVDIQHDTWCIDTVAVRQAITRRTRAIIAVHLYGNLCAMDELENIASEHGLWLIEDAAEALGSRWANRHAGTRGVFGIFSFHGTKTMTTGEGGMLVTNDSHFRKRVAMLNNHGRAQGDTRQFWATEAAYKFKMSNMQAALGCAQVERIEELTARRREIFFTYRQLLADYPDISMNPVPEDSTVYGYWMPTLVFTPQCGVTQDKALHALSQANIDGRAFFAPLSQQAGFSTLSKDVKFATSTHSSVSKEIWERAINLPSYHDLTIQEQQRVVTAVTGLMHA